ncbi:amidohydrolase family protein [Quatrionicoccus australiensis]|uniref:amidohydrolase family protein n=1 Tax=Quatrionicoccus australiensis TaxID=138118 RepID=UPI001CF95BBD|nr:amidohydrolase family protein [Quatrionicoccus australiensis]MCB4360412.1 amidohydrolase family protein [Quatrionicoccus australiensis]
MLANASRRRFVALLGGAAALSAAGWSSAKPVLVNKCRVAIPAVLNDSPWLKQIWDGIDPAQLWDCHVHLAGLGDGGSGIEIGPQLASPLHPLHYAQRLFYMNAGCAHDAPGKVDQAYVARLLNLCDAMPAGFKVMLFAFERFHDGRGDAHPEHSAFYVPNAWAAQLARDFPARFEWVASLHPYRADAVDRLEAAISGGARAVKWLPAAMGMDPADARCDAFYRVLARRGTPLIVHCGEEKAVEGSNTQALGNPLRLRRALDAGVRVVVAHCASLGDDVDDDGKVRRSFDLFLKLMAEPRARELLYGDISAISQRNRQPAIIRTLLERSDLHERLLHGSDYPLPGVVPLTSPAALARAGLLPRAAVHDLDILRQHNPLFFDFALKRLLRWQGHSFSPAVFATRRLFAASQA